MTKTIQKQLENEPSQSIQYLETVDAYNKWSEVYDTDGNFLQGLDTIEMRTILPTFLSKVMQTQTQERIKIVDLGCGTGRNTLQLLSLTSSEIDIIGLDASRGMLDVARSAIAQPGERDWDCRITLEIFDLLSSPLTLPQCALNATGIVSTLVLEHIPLEQFFSRAAALLRPGGLLLVTNMHSDMGCISQAGFVDVASGVKIRPTSYCHRLVDVVNVAERAGFRLEGLESDGDGGGGVRERMVDEGLLEVLGKRARKWVGINVWFGVCFRKMWS